MAFQDARRTDARDNLQGIPFVMTSAEIDVSVFTAGGGDIVLFSFPNANETYLIMEAYMEIITDFNAGTVDCGNGTLPLDTTAESGTYTEVSAQTIWNSADGVETTGTIFQTATTPNLQLAPVVLVGAASTVPCIHADIATATSGKFRLHIVVIAIPSYR